MDNEVQGLENTLINHMNPVQDKYYDLTSVS